jgi:hypothetical protein
VIDGDCPKLSCKNRHGNPKSHISAFPGLGSESGAL